MPFAKLPLSALQSELEGALLEAAFGPNLRQRPHRSAVGLRERRLLRQAPLGLGLNQLRACVKGRREGERERERDSRKARLEGSQKVQGKLEH